MKKRFVYFYLMKPAPERIGRVAPAHVEYWKSARLDEYRGGPFADRSGGLIEFAADTLEQATEIVGRDPFVSQALIEASWLKEWIPD